MRSTLWAVLTIVVSFPAAVVAQDATIPAKPMSYEVEVKKNIAYYDGKDADEERHKLDLYLPKGKKDFPVVFFVHGGAWTAGSKDRHAKVGQFLASNGIGAVLTNYRLSPKAQHPAHVEDVARAFAWTHKHIAEYGGRADQIVISGHSAGGHLVALLACDPTYLKAHNLSTKDMKGVVPISGVYTIGDTFPIFTRAFGKDKEICKAASPVTHVCEGLPPFLVLYGDGDIIFMRADSENLAKALQDKKCVCACREIKNHNHVQMIRLVGEADNPVGTALLEFVAEQTKK